MQKASVTFLLFVAAIGACKRAERSSSASDASITAATIATTDAAGPAVPQPAEANATADAAPAPAPAAAAPPTLPPWVPRNATLTIVSTRDLARNLGMTPPPADAGAPAR